MRSATREPIGPSAVVAGWAVETWTLETPTGIGDQLSCHPTTRFRRRSALQAVLLELEACRASLGERSTAAVRMSRRSEHPPSASRCQRQ